MRRIDPNKPVFVYRKLSGPGFKKGKPMYSIMQNGLVVRRQPRVLVTNATFVVRPNGRKRVLETKRKNVHAFVKGFLKLPYWKYPNNGAMGQDHDGKDFGIKLRYNPYEAGYFRTIPNGYIVNGAAAVLLNENGISATYIY